MAFQFAYGGPELVRRSAEVVIGDLLFLNPEPWDKAEPVVKKVIERMENLRLTSLKGSAWSVILFFAVTPGAMLREVALCNRFNGIHVIAIRCLENLTVLRGCRLAMMCNAYKNAAGRLPPDLNALEKWWGTSLPPDPFSGQPFQYREVSGPIQLFSLGENLKADPVGSVSVDETTFLKVDGDDLHFLW